MSKKRSFTTYTAPDGLVYDFKNPKTNNITNEPEHLYAKYLTVGKFDNIDNYVLIPDPLKEKQKND